MNRSARPAAALLAALVMAPLPAFAAGLSVDVSTRRGDQAVYQPGEALQVQLRTNHDAHVLVYEIDAEGYVNVVFPYEGHSDLIEGRRTHRIPDPSSDLELVVQGPVGQGYIVAIASGEPFAPLPWYLRPYNSQAAALGYQAEVDEEEGVTEEGRIVGDPFVAMERIRRRVVVEHEDPAAFATAYTSYYLHDQVKYPRYICYDCHRPNYWSWWTDFDPYYASCRAFTFRINYSWHWGPSYWFGYVPYYSYVCRPGYSWGDRYWYGSWHGWRHWNRFWGGPLRRHKTSAPADYIPPKKYKRGGPKPPGLISSRDKLAVPIGHNIRTRDDDARQQRGGRTVDGSRRIGSQRQPAREVRGDDDRGGLRIRRSGERQPAREIRPGNERNGRGIRREADRQPAREIRGTDRSRSPRMIRPNAKPQPRLEQPKRSIKRQPAQRAPAKRAPTKASKPKSDPEPKQSVSKGSRGSSKGSSSKASRGRSGKSKGSDRGR